MASPFSPTASSSTNLAQATVRGTVWTYLAYYSGKAMVFVSTIILARLLLKEDFGVAGYALTVIAFLDVLSDLGIGSALIYHRDDPRAADTAFWLGLLIGGALYVITWFIAPLAGSYFNDERAVPVTRVLALTFPLAALCNVHDVLLRKGLHFGRKFIPDFTQATSKGLLSIAFAWLGFGAWSLIWGQVAGTALAALAYWYVLPWRPSFQFVRSIARALLSYGFGIVSVNTLNIFVSNADYLFVGRFLGAAALGVYTLAFRIPELLILQMCSIISRVVFPVYAKMRDERGALQRGFLVTERYTALVTVPLSLGLILVAEPFVHTFLGERWLEAIPVLRAITLYALFLSFGYNAGDVYKAEGRPILLTWLTLAQALVLIPALYWAATTIGTIEAIGWTHVVVAFIISVVDLVVALRMLQTPVSAFLAVLRPALMGGAGMSLAVWITLQLVTNTPPWAQLLVSIAVGGLTYLGTLWVMYRDLMLETGQTLRAAFSRS